MSTAQDSAYETGNEIDEVSIGEFPLKRIAELEAFLIALSNPAFEDQSKDDEVFALTLQLAIDEYGISQTEIAKLLQTQKSTVGRWKSSFSAPISYSRPAVISVISTLLEKSIEDRKKRIKSS